jgi:hypothetical protein
LYILIIGSNYNWSLERIYRKELLNLGHKVELIPVQNWFYDYYYKYKLNKVIFRLGLSNILSRIQSQLFNEIGEKQYDLIWVFKGMELHPSTLRNLRLKNTKRLINFNPDNPFIFSSKGSGNKFITKSIMHYDMHFTYDKDVKIKIESEFGISCGLVPFGFDSDVLLNSELFLIKEINAVCFIGNPDKYRAGILMDVLKQGLPLHVFGNNWEDFLTHPNLKCHGPVYEHNYFNILRSYRVQLNIMRAHNLDSHNMRSIEITGCGGIMLAPKTSDHVRFFNENIEAYFYTDSESLIMKAKELLSLDFSKAMQIRMAASKKVLQKFTYDKLVNNFIKV